MHLDLARKNARPLMVAIVVFATMIPISLATAGPAGAGVFDPGCVVYVRDVPNNYRGSYRDYMQVHLSSGVDLVSQMQTFNGYNSSGCQQGTSGWSAEAMMTTYRLVGGSYQTCPGGWHYEYTTTGVTNFFGLACDGAQYYRTKFDHGVWFAGTWHGAGYTIGDSW
jgi:hypothetical protein